MKNLYKKIVETTDNEGVITEEVTLITANSIKVILELYDYENHEDAELVGIVRVGHVATDLTYLDDKE